MGEVHGAIHLPVIGDYPKAILELCEREKAKDPAVQWSVGHSAVVYGFRRCIHLLVRRAAK